MTHQELLEAYIKPAIDNNCLIEGQKIIAYRWGKNSTGVLTISTEDNEYSLMPLEILFNHVFASAFFGSEPAKVAWYKDTDAWSFEDGFVWQVHLCR